MKFEFLILIIITLFAVYTDYKTHTIKNKLCGLGMLLGIILSFFNDTNCLISLCVCICYFILLFYIPRKMEITEFIGAGDIKLYMVITLLMGYKFSIYTFVYATILGALFISLLNIKRIRDILDNVNFFFLIDKKLIKDKIDSQKSNIFSPYILIAILITYFQIFILNNDWLFQMIKF